MPDSHLRIPPTQKALARFLLVKARDVTRLRPDHFRLRQEINLLRVELLRFEHTRHGEVSKQDLPTTISETLPVQQLLADVAAYLDS